MKTDLSLDKERIQAWGLQPDKIISKYQKFKDTWFTSDLRKPIPEDRFVTPALAQCATSEAYLAAFADHLPTFESTYKEASRGKTLDYWIALAGAFGSKEVGNFCRQNYRDISELPKDHQDMFYSLLAISGNEEWFEEVISENGLKQVPDSAYKYVSFDQMDWLDNIKILSTMF